MRTVYQSVSVQVVTQQNTTSEVGHELTYHFLVIPVEVYLHTVAKCVHSD